MARTHRCRRVSDHTAREVLALAHSPRRAGSPTGTGGASSGASVRAFPGDQDHTRGGDPQREEDGQADRLAKDDRDERRSRPLGRGDGGRDGHLAGGQRRVRQQEPQDVAEAGDREQGPAPRRRAAAGARAATIGIAAMSPMSITQPRSTRDPSTPAAREAQSVAVPQANAATAPPTMASIGRGCRTHRPPWGAPSLSSGRLGAVLLASVAAPAGAPSARHPAPHERRSRSLWPERPGNGRAPGIRSGLKRVRQAERRHADPRPASHGREDARRARRSASRRSRAIGRSTPVAALDEALSAARSRGQGRRDPSERRGAPQVAPGDQGQPAPGRARS